MRSGGWMIGTVMEMCRLELRSRRMLSRENV